MKVLGSNLVLGVDSELFSKRFLKKVASKECNQDLWNLIVTKDVAEVDRTDCDSGKERHSSMKKLLTEELERKKEYLWISKKRAAIDVWLGWIKTFLKVDDCFKFRAGIPATDGRFHLTGSRCKAQTAHSNM